MLESAFKSAVPFLEYIERLNKQDRPPANTEIRQAYTAEQERPPVPAPIRVPSLEDEGTGESREMREQFLHKAELISLGGNTVNAGIKGNIGYIRVNGGAMFQFERSDAGYKGTTTFLDAYMEHYGYKYGADTDKEPEQEYEEEVI